MDPNNLTIKAQAALQEASAQATACNHQTIEPEHVLFGLLSDADGIVLPLLHQAGVNPGALRNRVDEIVVFDLLGRDEIAQIVDIQLRGLQRHLSERKLKLEVTEASVQVDAGEDGPEEGELVFKVLDTASPAGSR